MIDFLTNGGYALVGLLVFAVVIALGVFQASWQGSAFEVSADFATVFLTAVGIGVLWLPLGVIFVAMVLLREERAGRQRRG